MPRWILILFIPLFLVSCKKIKDPEFIRLTEVKRESITRDTVTLTCNAIFKNLNPAGGEIQSTDIDVYVNDIFATKVNQDIKTKVPRKAEFALPLTIKVPIKTLFKQRGSLLDNILETISTRSFNIKYQGEVKFKFAKIPITVPIDKEETVQIKV